MPSHRGFPASIAIESRGATDGTNELLPILSTRGVWGLSGAMSLDPSLLWSALTLRTSCRAGSLLMRAPPPAATGAAPRPPSARRMAFHRVREAPLGAAEVPGDGSDRGYAREPHVTYVVERGQTCNSITVSVRPSQRAFEDVRVPFRSIGAPLEWCRREDSNLHEQ